MQPLLVASTLRWTSTILVFHSRPVLSLSLSLPSHLLSLPSYLPASPSLTRNNSTKCTYCIDQLLPISHSMPQFRRGPLAFRSTDFLIVRATLRHMVPLYRTTPVCELRVITSRISIDRLIGNGALIACKNFTN